MTASDGTEGVDQGAALEDTVRAAEHLLDRAARPSGFAAAVGDAHYDAVWTRDAAITCLAATRHDGDRWAEAVVRTLRTVADHASPLGQLPNTVWSDGWWDFGEHAALDPTLFWCIAAGAAIEAGLPGADEFGPAVGAALRWARHLDAGGTGLLLSPVASDWMDSSVQRVGITLHANALYAWALRSAERLHLEVGVGPTAAQVRERLDLLLWPRPSTDPADALGHLPVDVRRRGLPHPATVAAHRRAASVERTHWASHLRWGHLVDVVDVLGNALAVLTDVGDADRRAAALDHLDALAVADPFPSRTLDAPVAPGGPDGMLDGVADANQGVRWRNPAWEYHNAASWPMVGGFHAWALRHAGRDAEADRLTRGLARACLEDGEPTFPEWRHGVSGEAGGARHQAWSAAGLLLALPGSVSEP